MLLALRAHWRNVLHGFWFVPGAVVLAFALLALGLVWIDRHAATSDFQILFGGSGSAARSVLSTIAGSLITVAGLALSITIVALQLVAGQYSPRATRELLADRFNQVSAGVFVGIFAYCLLVLRAVRDDTAAGGGFVPSLAVSVAIALGVAGLGVLLGFIHHMAQSIKLPAIASRVGRNTLAAVERRYPEQFGRPQAAEAAAEVARWQDAATPVYPARAGYVQQIRIGELARGLDRPGSRLHLLVRPGDFVTEGRPVAAVRPELGAAEEEVAERIREAIVVDAERDVGQDTLFGLQQLKDIVLRAVSPSVNDPSTAITCIGYLAACLERLASRSRPAEVRSFPEHELVVAAPAPSFAEHVDEAFAQLVAHADDVHVAVEALRGLALVARTTRARQAEYLPPLVETADRIGEAALATPRAEAERERIEAAVDEVHAAARGSRLEVAR